MALRHRNKRRQWSNDPISRSMRALAGRWSVPLQVMADAFRVTAEDYRRAVEFFSQPIEVSCDEEALKRLMSPDLGRPGYRADMSVFKHDGERADYVIYDEAATIDPDAWVTLARELVEPPEITGTVKLYPYQLQAIEALKQKPFSFTFYPPKNAEQETNRIEGGSRVTSESCVEPEGLRDRRA